MPFMTTVIFLGEMPLSTRLSRVAGLTVVLVLSVAYLVDATYNPFLYFRF